MGEIFSSTCCSARLHLNEPLFICLVGSSSPDEKYVFSAANLRKKFASSSNRASSLELEDKVSYSHSPKDSPVSGGKGGVSGGKGGGCKWRKGGGVSGGKGGGVS